MPREPKRLDVITENVKNKIHVKRWGIQLKIVSFVTPAHAGQRCCRKRHYENIEFLIKFVI